MWRGRALLANIAWLTAGPKPNLELSEEQLAFKGDASNAEHAAAHQERVALLKADQLAKVKAWERQHAELSGQKEQAKAARQLKSAQKKVSACRQDVESACLALKEAVKAADK